MLTLDKTKGVLLLCLLHVRTWEAVQHPIWFKVTLFCWGHEPYLCGTVGEGEDDNEGRWEEHQMSSRAFRT